MRSAFVGTTYKTTELKDRLYTYDYRKYTETVEITLADGVDGAYNTELTLTEENLWGGGIEVDEATSSDNNLDVGSAIIGSCTITIENLDGQYSNYGFLKARVVPYVCLELANGQIATVKMGEYYVEDESFDSTCVRLTCYDAMAKFDKPISLSSLSYPATLNSIVQDACTVCGVLSESLSLPHGTYEVAVKPDDTATTFRELIAWTGQINGRNARINTSGRLEFIWYDRDTLESIRTYGEDAETDHTISGTFGAPTVSLNDVTITQINVSQKITDAQTGDEQTVQYTNGSSGYTISIENNDLVQGYINGVASGSVISGWLYDQLNGFSFRRASFSCLSDPLIEAGDVAKLIDRKGNVYAIIISGSKFKVGSQQTIRSSAAEPERTSVQRSGQATKNYVNAMISLAEERAARANSINTVMETLTTDYATIATLNAESARITNLSTDYATFKDATADNFTADRASIATLQTGKANVTDLNAANANITNLTSSVANITTLLNGNQATENLQAITLVASKTNIDWAIIKNLFAEYFSAIDIDANHINTDEVTIGDENGTFLIDGNTLQILDDNNVVRIQIGRDANEDYTFTVFDEDGVGVLIDATGIKDGAVADGLIVDRMVKAIDNSYSGISGNKLNINSVVSRLNDDGTTSINATKIYVDEENQNAALVFSDIRDGLNDNTTAINVSNGKIDKLISSAEISQIPEGSTMYSQMHHIEETVNGYSETISSLETTINGDDEIVGLVSKIATVANNLDGFQNTVSRTYVTKNEVQTPNLVKESDLASRNRSLKGINYEYEGDGWWHIYGTVVGNTAGIIELYGTDDLTNLVTTDSDLCVRVETNTSPLLSGTDSQIQIRYAESSTAQTMSNAFINADGSGMIITVDSNDVMHFAANDVTVDQAGIMHISALNAGTDRYDSLQFYSYDDGIVLNREHNVGCRVATISHYIGADATGETIDGRIRIKLEHGEIATAWYPAAEDARYLSTTASASNLSPFFSYTPLSLDEYGDYWIPQSYTSGTFTFTDMGDGWVRVQCDNSSSGSTVRRDPNPKRCEAVRPNADYTIMMEFRNNNCVNTNSNSCKVYVAEAQNGQFWGDACKKVLEGAGTDGVTDLGSQFPPGATGTYKKRFVKTSEPLNSEHWTLAEPDKLFAVSFQAQAGCVLDIECRISLYEGEYLGGYAPYIDGSASSKIVTAKNEAIAAAEQIITETLDYGITANDGVIRTFVANNFVSQTTYDNFANTTVPNTYATQTALNTLQNQVNAMEQIGSNLIINTLIPDATASKRPKVRGQAANTAGRGEATTATHGIRFTHNSTSMSATNKWAYIRFGTSTVADADLLGLTAGETYTLSCDVKFKLFSGTHSSSTAAYLNVVVYTVNGSATSFSLLNGADPDRVIHTFATSDLTDRGVEIEERCEYTFTLPANAVKAYIDIRTNDTSNATSTVNSWFAVGDYIEASNLKLEKGSTATEWSPAYEDSADIRTYVSEVEASLSEQIDSKIETWFGTVAPTASNAPANAWTTDAIRDAHVGDLYYDRVSGYAYKYIATTASEVTTYSWQMVDNTSGIQTALTNASAAQAPADGKVTTFRSQPQASDSYDVGDIWVNATYPVSSPYIYQNDMLVCTTAKSAGAAFNINHWQKASKYTDDTAATNALTNAKNYTDSRLTNYTETSSLESYIETRKDQITSLVSDTYLTQATYAAMAIGGRNLLLETPTTTTPTAYNTYVIPTTETLQKTGYVLQLWGVTIDSNSTGIRAYWGGGNISMCSASVLPDANGYICIKWTPTDANMSHANASNKWISIYNFPNGHSGSNMTMTKWKLEHGNVATDYSTASEDVVSAANTYTDTNYSQTKSWVEQNSNSITSAVSRISAIDSDFDTLEALVNNSVTELIVGTQTGATNAWTGVASFNTLTDGKTIIYWLPQNSSSNVTLNLTLGGGSSTGPINCYFNGTTRLGTQYTAGSQIRMVYRVNATVGGSTLTGWWTESYTNTTSDSIADRMQYKAVVTAQLAISAGQIAAFNRSGYLIPLSGTTDFDVTKPILYVGTAYSGNGATGTDNYISWGTPFDLTATKSGFSGTAGASVYVKGTLNGTIFTPDPEVYTCTQPTTADGKVYMLLGLMSTSTYAVLAPEHPMYKFTNGSFKSTDQVAYEAQDVVETLDIGGLNLIRGTSFPSSEYFNLTNTTISDNVFTLTSARQDSLLVAKTGYLKYGDYKNDQYTLSFDGRVVNDSSGRSNGYLFVYIGVRSEANMTGTFDDGNSRYADTMVYTTSTSWNRYSYTVAVPDDLNSGATSALIDANCLNWAIFRFGSMLPVQIKNVKLERGNLATSYTPAPEDAQLYTDSKITVAKSEITQTTDSISLSVQANTTAIANNTTAIAGKMDSDVDGGVLVSRINLTPQEVSIDANKINLNGAVTANDYFKINTDGSMESIRGKVANFSISESSLYYMNPDEYGTTNLLSGMYHPGVSTSSGTYQNGSYRILGSDGSASQIGFSQSVWNSLPVTDGSAYNATNNTPYAIQLKGTTKDSGIGLRQDVVHLIPTPITFHVWVQANSLAIGGRVRIQPFYAAGDKGFRAKEFVLTGEWQHISCVAYPSDIYPGVSAAYIYFYPKVSSTNSSNSITVFRPALVYGEYDETSLPYWTDEEYAVEIIEGQNNYYEYGTALTRNGITVYGRSMEDTVCDTINLRNNQLRFIDGSTVRGYLSYGAVNHIAENTNALEFYRVNQTNPNAKGSRKLAIGGSTTSFWTNLSIVSSSPRISFCRGSNSTTESGYIAQASSGGNLTAYPGISNASDARLKKDIVDMDDCYTDLLDKLEPKEYRFRKNDAYINLGFIAQDVVKELEDLGIEDMPIVGGTGEGEDYYSLDYSQFIPILVRKCQKQDEEIQKLKDEVAGLRNMVMELAQK